MRNAQANKSITPTFPPGHVYTADEYKLIAPPTYGPSGSNPVDDSKECQAAQRAADKARAEFDRIDARWLDAAADIQTKRIETGAWDGPRRGKTLGLRPTPQSAQMANTELQLEELREEAWDAVVAANVALAKAQQRANGCGVPINGLPASVQRWA